MESSLPTVQYGFLTHDFPVHNHRLWEIHLFTGGRGTLTQGEVTWPLGPGCVTLSPPGVEHSLGVFEPLSFYYVQFGADKSLSVLDRLLERQSASGPLPVDETLVTDAGRVKVRLDSPLPDRVASGVHAFRAWLYDLAAGGGDPEPDGIDRTLVWLRHNLDRRLDLETLASVAGLDKFAFCRKFRARTGLSPLAYVHRSKVEAAGFLLAGTDLPLTEVALRLGFCDEFHFGKVFKKWRGTTPGRWRRSTSGASPKE